MLNYAHDPPGFHHTKYFARERLPYIFGDVMVHAHCRDEINAAVRDGYFLR